MPVYLTKGGYSSFKEIFPYAEGCGKLYEMAAGTGGRNFARAQHSLQIPARHS